MMSKLVNIAFFSFLLTVFVPQGGHTSASVNPKDQQIKNLAALQEDFRNWQVAVLEAHGHRVKVNMSPLPGSKLLDPIDILTITHLSNITSPPSYISRNSHIDEPGTHIKKWIAQADDSIRVLRTFSGASFAAGGLLVKYEALKKKMSEALQIK
ncbi:MAG: hypothetical protein GW748_00440 [Alphaproteobacteria bacterium]|nr:hypothetical protein [Alphaproteobacteria bacterium]NCQ66200.1 hypothetical protein [Alphaproteobacteria bacterium]NCT06548.1 hypothetical protein [Alphaproteobacteria bacterium]